MSNQPDMRGGQLLERRHVVDSEPDTEIIQGGGPWFLGHPMRLLTLLVATAVALTAFAGTSNPMRSAACRSLPAGVGQKLDAHLCDPADRQVTRLQAITFLKGVYDDASGARLRDALRPLDPNHAATGWRQSLYAEVLGQVTQTGFNTFGVPMRDYISADPHRPSYWSGAITDHYVTVRLSRTAHGVSLDTVVSARASKDPKPTAFQRLGLNPSATAYTHADSRSARVRPAVGGEVVTSFCNTTVHGRSWVRTDRGWFASESIRDGAQVALLTGARCGSD